MAKDLALDSDSTDADEGPRTNWWAEARGILWLILAVLAFHSLVAKPFYIPSESMLPTLRVGDRLIVTKYPYGFSFVSPTFHVLPPLHGRLLGHMPERGDVVIVTPPGSGTDYIKRVIGLPGDTIMLRGGVLWLNGRQVQRRAMGDRLIPVDANSRCDDPLYEGRLVTDARGKQWCRFAIFRETLPNGRSYDTIDLGYRPDVDDYGPMVVPQDKVFLMGDNRDDSADSRVSADRGGLGGAVPWENLGGRAEFITFSLDGSATWDPRTWPKSFRSGRAGTSLRPDEAPQP